MRPIMKYTMCAIAAAAMTAPALAASDYYLKLGDIKGESAARSGGRERLDVESFHWGPTQAAGNVEYGWKVEAGEKAPPPPGGVRVASGDVNADGRADTITSPRDTASGMPTGKRQHGWVKISKPLDRGSVTVKGKFPGCTVGAAHSDAVLQTAAARYEFKEVFITSCSMPGMSGGDSDDRPTESISFNYGKIETVYAPQSKDKSKVDVRGWDPAKKQ